ncbi:hypothetical protein [Rhabdaerophilum sp.]|uniref:hypothetical protein n=1 Tax=Rhabdaerophilum sp. TaxID=2717341 RepID=UPI0038D4DCF9
MRAALVAACVMVAGASVAQTPDPFTLPPPTQAPRPPGQQAPGGQPPVVNIEALTRQGVEIKAMERASDRANGFVVMLQRAGEVRTCLMRLERDQGQAPRASSVCF